MHRVDEDPVVSQRRGSDRADRVHGRLRDTVAQAVGGHAAHELSGLRREDHDACVPGRAERREQRLREEERRLDVHAKDFAEGVSLDLVQPLARSWVDGGVVHEDVQRGRGGGRLLRDSGDPLGGREVADHRDAADLVGQGLRRRSAARMAEHAGSFGGERPRDRGADPARRASDECVLAAQRLVIDHM